jgi:hypothetical protein
MSTAAKAATQSGCNPELWDQVYPRHPLHIIEGGITVKGTIRHSQATGPTVTTTSNRRFDREFSKLLNERSKTAPRPAPVSKRII